MLMPVMGVWEMFMAVLKRQVCMSVVVLSLGRYRRKMLMLMM